MIVFTKPTRVGTEVEYVSQSILSENLSGDGPYTKKCHDWFLEHLECSRVLLTPSCTAALEIAALLLNIRPGDEVIMPSYTFVSTANAFVLRGARIVFVDIRPDTMNIDETLIEAAITPQTKAIVVVHYAGVSCEMDTIMEIANKKRVYVVEDAAQGMMSQYKGRALGTIGHLGTYSFHATKNYTSGGEGGLLIVNSSEFSERAEFLREKGTNRTQFIDGKVAKYSWIDVGGSHLPSELQAAYLYPQLLSAKSINEKRLAMWQLYFTSLKPLADKKLIELPNVPSSCVQNAHIFYVKLGSEALRSKLISYLEARGIQAVTHYVPLHSSSYGKKVSVFSGSDDYTTLHSEMILRLPLHYGITSENVIRVVSELFSFFSSDFADYRKECE